MLHALSLRSALPFVLVLFASTSTTLAGTASFDLLTEGQVPAVFANGGITFFNFDNLLGGTPPLPMVIDQASSTLTGISGFSTPNALGFTGFTPGPSAAFSRIFVVCMTTGQVETSGRINLFESGSGAGNTISLEAMLSNVVVQTTSLTTLGTAGTHHYTMSISGVGFDTLRLIGSGPNNQGCFFALLDDVSIPDASGGSFPAFCNGDGIDPNVTTACPCGNFGAQGHGCANSVNS